MISTVAPSNRDFWFPVPQALREAVREPIWWKDLSPSEFADGFRYRCAHRGGAWCSIALEHASEEQLSALSPADLTPLLRSKSYHMRTAGLRALPKVGPGR
jgi:hypothetical protein